MSDLPEDQNELLNKALDKAQHLVDELRRQQADLDACHEKLDSTRHEAGRQVLAGAIAAAQKTVQNVQAAIRQSRPHN